MRSLFRVTDAFLDLAIPFYLLIVSFLLAVPHFVEDDQHWFNVDVLPSFFDANAKLVIVLPLVLFSIGLGIKHLRLVWSDRLPRRLWAIAVLGAGVSILIVSIVYFTMRIDAFWLNVPSMTAYVFIRYSDDVHRDGRSRVLNFINFMGRNARLTVSAVCLYASLFMVFATGVRVELINQHTAFLEEHMKVQTKNLITVYQNQHECFGNKVAYETNLIFQILVLTQPFDEQCAGTVALTEWMDTVDQMIASGTPIDLAALQSLAALIVQFAGRGMDDATAKKFDSVFGGAPDVGRICTSDGSFCVIRMSNGQSGS